jgi:tetratricopeptide (TPR) repeat protein
MKWNSLPLCLFLATSVFATFPSAAMAQTQRENSEARRLFNEGVEFQNNGNFVAAEQKFRETLRRYPNAEQTDRTYYYLIDTLLKLQRVPAARIELDNLSKKYPKSKWLVDANEQILSLGGQPRPAEAPIWNSPAEVREAQYRANVLLGVAINPGIGKYPEDFPRNASTKAEMLRLIIQLDPDGGIEDAKTLLKANPSDPAVMVNLGTIANSDSPQKVTFLFSIWGNAAASPNMRNSAYFWFARMNPNREEVAKTTMDLLAKPETEKVGSEALFRLSVADHRAVLEKIVMSSNPEKFPLMKKIYQNGSVMLRSDLLMFVGRLSDPKSVPFIIDAAQNDADASVRRAAVQALSGRKDVDVETLRRLMNSAPPAPRTPQTTRVPQVPSSGVIPFTTIPALPYAQP